MKWRYFNSLVLPCFLLSSCGHVYLRIDSIEQAIRDFRADSKPLDDAGYRIGYAVAEDNLRLGRTVVADSVNPT